MTKMPELDKPKLPFNKQKLLTLVAAALVSFLVYEVIHLQTNLRSTTRVTQNLRNELEGLRQEKTTFQQKAQSGEVQVQELSTELTTLKEDKTIAVQKHEELKHQVESAENMLENQNKKILDLEKRLKDADEKIRRHKKASDNLEQQTRSARSNPAMTAEYVKLVESQWLTAETKTQELKSDLDKSLAELSSYNMDRQKMRSETATMHYNLAVILTNQQNYEAAIREYLKVLELRPDDAESHYNLGIIYDDYSKNHEKAIEHYRQFVRVSPDSPETNKVKMWLKEKEVNNTYNLKL
jgi:chromosome segregation ATPase